MNKALLQNFINQFADNLKLVLIKYSVEYAILIYAYVILSIEFPEFKQSAEMLYLAPAFILLAYIANKIFTKGIPRIAYYAVLVLYFVCQVFLPYKEIVDEPAFWITSAVILPILALLCGTKLGDRSLVRNALNIAFSAFVIGMFQSLSMALLAAIFSSFILLFDVNWEIGNILFHTNLTLGLIIFPLLFLALYDQMKSVSIKPIKLLDIVMNYIFTPAIWIYLTILFAYLAKIIFQWSLPNGYIASLTFGFMVVVIIARALYQFVGANNFKKFYNILSWFILPVLVLFWIGSLTRVCEYGFTPLRVYMVLCGVFITIHTLLFLTKIKIRYAIFCGAIIGGFAITAYIPYYEATQISLRSQVSVAEDIAKELNLLNKENKIDLNLLSKITNDSVGKLETLQSAIQFVYSNDSSLAINKFGIEDIDLLSNNISKTRQFYQVYFSNFQKTKTDVSNYKYLYNSSNCEMNETKDSVIINNGNDILMTISAKDIFNAYLKSVGDSEKTFKHNMLKNNDSYDSTSSFIELDSVGISLRNIRFDNNLNKIESIGVEFVLIK